MGVAVEVGKDVQGFQKGDRCVADVGITVSVLSFHILIRSNLTFSATTVSTAVAARPCSARTLGLGELARLVALLNTSSSKSSAEMEVDPFTDPWLALVRASPQHKLYKINNISDLEATLGAREFQAYLSIHRTLTDLFSRTPVAEPLACAIHGVDVIQPKVGSEGKEEEFT